MKHRLAWVGGALISLFIYGMCSFTAITAIRNEDKEKENETTAVKAVSYATLVTLGVAVIGALYCMGNKHTEALAAVLFVSCIVMTGLGVAMYAKCAGKPKHYAMIFTLCIIGIVVLVNFVAWCMSPHDI